MPLITENGATVPDIPKFELGKAFSVGDWNMGPGGGRFAPVMRSVLPLPKKVELLKKVSRKLKVKIFMEFHDTEAEPSNAKNIAWVVREGGLAGIHMCTANLFKRGPEFANGNFASPDPQVRGYAIKRTKQYIWAGINEFGAKVYVYWNGSNGFRSALGMNYRDAYRYTVDCIAEITQWQLDEFGTSHMLPFCIEPKGNEPPSYGLPADAGETLALISMLPLELQPYVGTNIETCHSQLVGKRFAHELALVAAAGKCFYVHLNGGTGMKFDEDLAFGDGDPGVAVETVYTLQEIGYCFPIGLDVQPLNTDREDQQIASIERSIRNFQRAQACAARINPEELNGYRMAGDQAAAADLFSRAVYGLP